MLSHRHVLQIAVTAACSWSLQGYADTAADLDRLLTTGACSDCDLRGVDLAGRELNITSLRNSDLSGANLAGLQLRASTVERNRFDDANMAGMQLWANQIQRNSFVRADLTDSSLNSSSGHGQGWSFIENDLRDAKLTRTVVQTDICYNSPFNGVDMTGMILKAFDVSRGCFVGGLADASKWSGKFLNHNFSGSFKGGHFYLSAGSDAKFLGADLSGAYLTIEGGARVSFPGAKLDGATINDRRCAVGSLGECLDAPP